MIEERITRPDVTEERPSPKILKIVEAAAFLTQRSGRDFGGPLVRKLIKFGDLPVRRLGRHQYIPVAALERYLSELLADEGERVSDPLRRPTSEGR